MDNHVSQVMEEQSEVPNDVKTVRNKTKREQYYNDFRSNTSMTMWWRFNMYAYRDGGNKPSDFYGHPVMGTDGVNVKVLNLDSNGNLKTILPGFQIPNFDSVVVTYPVGTVEVYTYKTGGVLGSVVAVVTLTYSDSTKSNLLSAVRT